MPKPTAQASDEQSASDDLSAPDDSPVSDDLSVSDDLPVSGELRDTLRWATGRLREIYGPRLKRLILFGSQARGDAEPESDVDLLVVLEGPVTSIEEAKRTSRVATRAAAYQGTVLSFVHMSEQKFETGLSPLVWAAEEDGVDLLERVEESASPKRNVSSSSRPPG